MSIRTAAVAAACLGFSVTASHAQQGDDPAAAPENWGVTVIELDYANADELAAVLADMLPPGLSVRPYYRTNSLIISGDRDLLDALVGEPTESSPAERGNNQAPQAEPVRDDVTAQLKSHAAHPA